jgi:hypothetical protein
MLLMLHASCSFSFFQISKLRTPLPFCGGVWLIAVWFIAVCGGLEGAAFVHV